ncbi:MAG: IPT/TIG domain-containing protein, partial [Myxococcota bacterium]
PNRLLAVAAASGSVTRQVALAHEPRDLVAASGGTKLVVGAANGWLSTVDAATFGVDSQLKVGDEIRSLAWWETGARTLAVHKRTDAVSLIDIAVPQVSATVALDGDPDKGAVAVGGSTGYVATHDDASVNRVDLAAPGLLGRYAVAARFNALVFDAAANVLYGAQLNDRSLLRLDPAGASLISVLQLQKRLRDVAINQTTHEAVAVADKTDEMFVIKLSDRSVRGIALPARPDLVAVDAQLNRAVVAFKGSGPKLRFADLVGNTLFAESVEYDKNLNAVAVDATRSLALAIADADRPVLFVNIDTRTRLADGPADRYRALAVHSARGVAYLATDDRKLKVMDLGTRALTATLELGFKVNAIAVDEGLDKAVLTTDSDDKAHVLNLATLQLEANHVVPKHPSGVSIQPDTHVAVIASRESDKLSLLDLASNTLTPGFTSIDKVHTAAVSGRYNLAVALSGEKDEVAFVQLPNPVPVLESLAPMQAAAGSPALTIALTGNGFTDQSRVYFGETELVTRWQSTTQLEADVTAALLATPASVPVTVRNPAPAGGTSDALNFTVGAAPVLAALQPASAVADGQDKALVLTGENFAGGASVLFGTTSLPATFQSSTSLTVVVPGSLTATAGVVPVSVVNP